MIRGTRVLHEAHGYITPAQLSGTDTSAEPVVNIATVGMQVSIVSFTLVINATIYYVRVEASTPTISYGNEGGKLTADPINLSQARQEECLELPEAHEEDSENQGDSDQRQVYPSNPSPVSASVGETSDLVKQGTRARCILPVGVVAEHSPKNRAKDTTQCHWYAEHTDPKRTLLQGCDIGRYHLAQHI